MHPARSSMGCLLLSTECAGSCSRIWLSLLGHPVSTLRSACSRDCQAEAYIVHLVRNWQSSPLNPGFSAPRSCQRSQTAAAGGCSGSFARPPWRQRAASIPRQALPWQNMARVVDRWRCRVWRRRGRGQHNFVTRQPKTSRATMELARFPRVNQTQRRGSIRAKHAGIRWSRK